jgi:hypothetical protein
MRVDIPFAAFFLSAFYFASLFIWHRHNLFLLLSFANAGMCLGIKSSGIVYLFILFIGVIMLSWQSHKLNEGRISFSTTLIWIMIGTLCAFMIGGSWYFRNFVQHGSPLGLFSVSIANYQLFPGRIDLSYLQQTTLANLFDLRNREHWFILINAIRSRFGLPLIIFLFEIVIGTIAVLFSGNKLYRRNLILLDLLLLLLFILYIFTPYTGDNGGHNWQITPWIGQQMRFAFPVFGLLAVAAAVGATSSRLLTEAAFFFLALGIGPSVSQGILFPCLLVGIVMISGLVIPTLHQLQSLDFTPQKAIFSSLLLMGVVITGMFFVREYRDHQRALVYNNVQWTDAYTGFYEWYDLHVDRDDKVGYTLSHHSYLLYGKQLDRQVVYITPNSDSPSQFIDQLQSQGIDLLILGPLLPSQQKAKEVVWVESNTKFIKVFGSNPAKTIVAYRLNIP